MWDISRNKFKNECGKCCCQCLKCLTCFYSCLNDEIGSLVYCENCEYMNNQIKEFIIYSRKKSLHE